MNSNCRPAKVRVKVGGGIAGHNGLRSISSHIGNDYRRVRLGIGHPGIKELVHGYVLSDFAKSDRPWVEALCEAVADNAGLLATDRDSTFQNKVHLAMQAKGFFDKDDDGGEVEHDFVIAGLDPAIHHFKEDGYAGQARV